MAFYSKLTNFLSRDKESGNTYLSIALTSSKIFASVWELAEDRLEFVGFADKKFHNIDGLIHEAAAAIDDAAQKAKTDVSQVVFGLSAYWLEDGKLTKETSNILKDLCDNLDLDAQAFVPLASSVNHFLKVQNSESPSLVLIGALGEFTEAHLLSSNSVKNTKIYKGEASFEKVSQLIRQLKTDEGKDLAAKVVLFGLDKDSHLAKELEKNKLDEIFAEKPDIQFISEVDLAKSVAFSQAADILGHDPLPQNSAIPVLNLHGDKSENDNLQEQKVEDQVSQDFGFVSGVDVLKSVEATKVESQQEVRPKSKEDYAVVVENVQALQVYESPKQKLEQAQKTRHKSLIESFMTLSYLSKFTGVLGSGGQLKKLAIVSAFLLVLAIVAGFVVSQTLTTAEVIVKVNSKPFEEDFDATVANGASLDLSRMRIPGEEITATVSDSQQANATGSKKTGTNAKGEVKVLNWTTAKFNFDKATVIISKNGVKFDLDNQVEIASRSASLPGEANTTVTAIEFGTAGNLDGGTDFTFQKYDELLYSAKSTNAFTGGDEKQATVVSADDQLKLEKSLLQSLTEKSRSALSEKLSGKNVSDSAIDVKVVRKTFDHSLDEEASQLRLEMETEARALAYDEQILKDLLSQKAQESQDSSLEAKADNIDILDLESRRNKDILLLSGKYRANLVPKLNNDDLKNKIKGKDTKNARTILKEIGEVADVEFKFFPNLLFFSQIPKNLDKIQIKIEAVK